MSANEPDDALAASECVRMEREHTPMTTAALRWDLAAQQAGSGIPCSGLHTAHEADAPPGQTHRLSAGTRLPSSKSAARSSLRVRMQFIIYRWLRK